jgi:hypothetical protein
VALRHIITMPVPALALSGTVIIASAVWARI